MGHKILDVKEDIKEDIHAWIHARPSIYDAEDVAEALEEIVDKHFEKIER
jgi:hypothetical protein